MSSTGPLPDGTASDHYASHLIGLGKLGYRPSLDGIRAVAIAFVIASHAHPTALKGGSLGVDVFFALSGFLITTLIVEELNSTSERYSFRRFYARRSLRLFPALYACVLLVALYLVLRRDHLGAFLHASGVDTPYRWTTWAKFVLGAATYSTNLLSTIATPGNLLGHTWSLALEEQFYLLWPVVVVMMWRRSAAKLLAKLVLGFIVICLLLRLGGAPTSAGFLWDRPEAIGAGAFVALARLQFPAARAAMVRAATVIAYLGGLVIVAIPIAGPREALTIALYRGLFPVYGFVAALTVWSLIEIEERHPILRLLESRPLVYLGGISYGLYIWHLPIFRIVTWEFPQLGGAANILVKMSVSLVAAVLSAHFIERPFRAIQAKYRTPTVSDVASGMAEAIGDSSGAN